MIEQGSIEWKLQRVGKVTASRAHDVIAKTKTGYSSSRANYRAELVIERLTGQPFEQYQNAAMKWGSDQQAAAQAAYEFITDHAVETVGFIDHPRIEMCGASPDGLVGRKGLVEFKCPNSATHIETLLGAPIAAAYVTQMQFQMATTGRDYVDFMSFDPRLPVAMQTHIKRVDRDQTFIENLEAEVYEFLLTVRDTENELLKRYPGAKAAA